EAEVVSHGVNSRGAGVNSEAEVVSHVVNSRGAGVDSEAEVVSHGVNSRGAGVDSKAEVVSHVFNSDAEVISHVVNSSGAGVDSEAEVVSQSVDFIVCPFESSAHLIPQRVQTLSPGSNVPLDFRNVGLKMANVGAQFRQLPGACGLFRRGHGLLLGSIEPRSHYGVHVSPEPLEDVLVYRNPCCQL